MFVLTVVVVAHIQIDKTNFAINKKDVIGKLLQLCRRINICLIHLSLYGIYIANKFLVL